MGLLLVLIGNLLARLVLTGNKKGEGIWSKIIDQISMKNFNIGTRVLRSVRAFILGLGAEGYEYNVN